MEAWPCKWNVPELDSDSSSMAIEKIELAVEKVERDNRPLATPNASHHGRRHVSRASINYPNAHDT